MSMSKSVAGLLLMASPFWAAQAQEINFEYYQNDSGGITITRYIGAGGAVEVPKDFGGVPVTSIWGYLIHTPGGYITVGAFSGCRNVTSVKIPASVSAILYGPVDMAAFFGCTGLAAFEVDPDNPAYSSLDGVLFNKTQTTLMQYPASKAARSYRIPDEVTNIWASAFSACRNLTEVSIPETVTAVGSWAFSGCTGLTNVTIPGSISTLEDYVFAHCTGLTSATILPGVTTISNAFRDCTNLTKLTIPESVASLWGSFAGCTGLTNVDIRPGMTNLGAYAFSGCTSLAGLTIPDSVASIGKMAFDGCTSLQAMTIPASVTEIASGGSFVAGSTGFGFSVRNAFAGCNSLTEINVSPLNLLYSSVNGVLLDKSGTMLLQFPAGRGGAYAPPETIKSLGAACFFSCSSVTSVTIPEEVTDIPALAFGNCGNLAKVIVPASVTKVGYSVFSACSNLFEVCFEGDCPELWPPISGFQEATNLTLYYLPGATGWGPAFGGRPTAIWTPRIEGGFGVQANHFGFNITWARNRLVVVEACTNLLNPVWSAVQPPTLTDGSACFSDPEWTNHPACFYRVRPL